MRAGPRWHPQTLGLPAWSDQGHALRRVSRSSTTMHPADDHWWLLYVLKLPERGLHCTLALQQRSCLEQPYGSSANLPPWPVECGLSAVAMREPDVNAEPRRLHSAVCCGRHSHVHRAACSRPLTRWQRCPRQLQFRFDRQQLDAPNSNLWPADRGAVEHTGSDMHRERLHNNWDLQLRLTLPASHHRTLY